MRAASSNGRARAVGRSHEACAVGRGQLWAAANRAGYARLVVGRSLPAVALAMAALAAVLLPIAIARRCSHPAEAPPLPLPPTPPTMPDEGLVAAMFGAVCRHEVGCGTGDLVRCAYVEDTMRKMPKELAVRPCERLDTAEARRCITELATRDCKDSAKSLDVLQLQAALARVRSCRLACPTASSP